MICNVLELNYLPSRSGLWLIWIHSTVREAFIESDQFRRHVLIFQNRLKGNSLADSTMSCELSLEEKNLVEKVDHEPNDLIITNESISEETSDQSTMTGSTDLEPMTLELSNKKTDEFESLTSMADSTMKEGLGSSEAVTENIELHCSIEQVNGSTLVQVKEKAQDSKVMVPFNTSFSDLLATVLKQLGYSDNEVLGAKGMIIIKNWKPLMFEAITDDPKVKVGDILGELSKLATLKIRLFNSTKYGILEDVKDKLLFFLLRNSKEMLQECGCPIKQAALEQMLREACHLPENLKHRFYDWYHDQEIRHKRKRTLDTEVQIASGTSLVTPGQKETMTKVLKTEKENGPGNGIATEMNTKMVPRIPAFGRLCKDLKGNQLEPKRYNKQGLDLKASMKHEMLLNVQQQQVSQQKLNNITTSLRQLSDMHMHPANADKPKDSTLIIPKRNAERKLGMSSDSEEDELVPELPNKNAVYVVRPLSKSSSNSESMELVLINDDESESEFENCKSTSEPQDLSRSVSSAAAVNENKHGDESNSCLQTMCDSAELPTNLSMKGRSKDFGTLFRGSKRKSETVNKTDSVHAKGTVTEAPMASKDSCNYSNDHHSDFTVGSRSESCSPVLSQNFTFGFGYLPQIQALHEQTQRAASQLLVMPNAMHFMHQLPVYGSRLRLNQRFHSSSFENTMNSDSEHKKRSRVFIDPISETPILENWFLSDSHPSMSTIEDYTRELNQSSYRQRFPKLEPKNVQLWFKNHRAKVKRMKNDTTVEEI